MVRSFEGHKESVKVCDSKLKEHIKYLSVGEGTKKRMEYTYT